MILVLLQNAWSTYYTRIGRPGEVHDRPSYREAVKNRVWPRESWLDATWASRSGQVLTKLLRGVPEDDIWIDDTTLEIADHSSGVLPTDPEHVAQLLAREPELVIACGKQAEAAVAAWDGPLLLFPHPAYRVLNNSTILAANRIILDRSPSRCRIKPTKDGHYVASSLALVTEESK